MNEKPNAEELPVTGAAGIILDGRYLPPPKIRMEKSGSGRARWFNAPEDFIACGAMWSLRPLARADRVSSATGERTSHWVMQVKDKRVEWDSEILNDEPGKRIAWRSIDGDSDNAGEVIFERATADRGTMVTVLQEFKMSKLASAWETLTGRNPKQAVIENLRHFKALAETGEIPRTQGQPHGPRGLVGESKASAYGEKIATPAGTKAS